MSHKAGSQFAPRTTTFSNTNIAPIATTNKNIVPSTNKLAVTTTNKPKKPMNNTNICNNNNNIMPPSTTHFKMNLAGIPFITGKVCIYKYINISIEKVLFHISFYFSN